MPDAETIEGKSNMWFGVCITIIVDVVVQPPKMPVES